MTSSWGFILRFTGKITVAKMKVVSIFGFLLWLLFAFLFFFIWARSSIFCPDFDVSVCGLAMDSVTDSDSDAVSDSVMGKYYFYRSKYLSACTR